MEKLLGGSPLRVLFRLIVLSVIVGIVLAATGIEPFDVIEGLRKLVLRIYDMGFEAFDKALSYFIAGAILVIPIWLLARLFKLGRSGKG